jgi:hypothetical protein
MALVQVLHAGKILIIRRVTIGASDKKPYTGNYNNHFPDYFSGQRSRGIKKLILMTHYGFREIEHAYRDWDGNPVKKNRHDYRYSYDPYVIFQKRTQYDNCVYSDRLYQWDSKKYNLLCEKHFGNQGQMWSGRPIKKIESFLQDYHDNPNLELVGVMEGCNVSTGFPYWIFMFCRNLPPAESGM